MKAKIRIIDNKIACCSQMCDKDSCPHYASCPEYEILVADHTGFKFKINNDYCGEWSSEWYQNIKNRIANRNREQEKEDALKRWSINLNTGFKNALKYVQEKCNEKQP